MMKLLQQGCLSSYLIIKAKSILTKHNTQRMGAMRK